MLTPVFGTLIAQFGDGLEPPVDNLYTQDATTDPLSTLEVIISNMVGLLTVLSAIIFLYFFLTGALAMISAAGDTSKINKARDQMLHAVIGITITVASYGVIGLVGSIVGLKLLSPAELLTPLIPM